MENNNPKKIFISYSRYDKKQVFKLKDEIDKVIGTTACWIDLTDIETDEWFIDVIIDAINQAEIFLFILISAALYFNVFYKYLSNKKLLRILPCQKFHLS